MSEIVDKNILDTRSKKSRLKRKEERERKKLSPYVDQALLQRAKKFRPQKSLGQNFLVDGWILDEITQLVDLDPKKDVVIEIGPGLGFLTERLLPHCKHLFAVDIDASTQRSMDILGANNKNFSFLRQDFLRTQLKDLKKQLLELYPGEFKDDFKFKIVANIPYQISSHILVHLFGEIGKASENKELVDDVYILVQKEFAQRLCAEPGIKAYGSMTLLMKYWAETEFLFEVEPNSFYPAPRVDSAYIRITPREKPYIEMEKPKRLKRFIHAVFLQRRKKLANSLISAGYNKEKVRELDLGNLRGETMTMEDMRELLEKLDPIN